MRTTVDIPDEVFRKMKAKAALEGRKLRDVILEAIGAGLEVQGSHPKAKRVSFPILKSSRPGTLTSERVYEAIREMETSEGQLG